MNDYKYFKFSKDNLWAIIKFLFALSLLKIIWDYFVRKVPEIFGTGTNKFILILYEPSIYEFVIAVIFIILILIVIWVVLYEVCGNLLMRLVGKIEPKSVKGTWHVKFEYKLTKEDMVKLDKKFKRKIIGPKEKEWDHMFANRILEKTIDKLLK